MSAWIGAVILVAVFSVLIQRMGLAEQANAVMTVAFDSIGIIGSSELSDDEKEVGLQKNSLKLLGLFFKIVFSGALALLVPMGIVWLGDQLGLLSLEAVLNVLISPPFLIVSGLLLLGLYIALRRKSQAKSDAYHYSAVDQALHRVAFKTYTTQASFADIEDRVFSKQLDLCQSSRPVFITALPSAGTTLLLECLATLPEFATHCYRDMPFVLLPCFWNRYSRAFQRDVRRQERAHGDGMEIDVDSPEALEEIIWKTFWTRHYKENLIIPWSGDRNPSFEVFFRSHMRKIILLRRRSGDTARYVSKNNANIARTEVLRGLFPDAAIVIPFRNPFHHAMSLLQQHHNFLAIHERDSFASEYMAAIGHYDFGQNLRPINFDGWLDHRQSPDAESLNFWLEYWIASYRHLLNEAYRTLSFVNYDRLCQDPEGGLRRLAEVIHTKDIEALTAQKVQIGRPRSKQIDMSTIHPSLRHEASGIYDQLSAAACF